MKESRKTHYYRFYGNVLTGFGPSMDPHRCGNPEEPCVTITEEREVTPWEVVATDADGDAQAEELARLVMRR